MHKYQSHRKSLDSKLRVQGTYHSSRGVANHHHSQDGIRTGLAALPAEVLHLICRLLCLCSHCEPPNIDPLDMSPLIPAQFKADLDSLTRTCQFIREVAQPYIFHDLGTWDKHFTHRPALKISVDLPRVANQVRAITLNSIWGETFSLSRMTGLKRLRVNAIEAGGIGRERQLSFPCLQELCYGPSLEAASVVGMEDARKDLRAILSASEKISHLRCQRLRHDITSSPCILLRLPACKITTLELHRCWLPRGTFRRFMASFPCLETFKFIYSMFSTWEDLRVTPTFEEDGPGRVADAADVAAALSPARRTLKRLILDFGERHELQNHFRALPPMKTFTALRTMHLTKRVAGRARDSLIVKLPRSIEELFIYEFREDFKNAVLDLAEQAVAGEFPNLKHVRLIKGIWAGFMQGKPFLDFVSRVDALEASDNDVNDFDIVDIGGDEVFLQPMLQRVGKVEDGQIPEGSDSDSFLDGWNTRENVDVCRRLLKDSVLRASIARHTDEHEHSSLWLQSSLDSRPFKLRREVRMLFSKANVKFESVGVEIYCGGQRRDEQAPIVWL